MGETMDSHWWYILLALFLIAFLFLFFWNTPCNGEEAKKK